MNDTAKPPVLQLQKIYLKDVSLETPMGYKAFRQAWKPRFEQHLQTTLSRLEEDLQEVVLTVTLRALLGESDKNETAFIIEVQQAGLFRMNPTPDAPETRLVNIVCPTILFPYLREAIDNLAMKAGFPPITLAPVNFEVLYQQAMQQQQQATTAH